MHDKKQDWEIVWEEYKTISKKLGEQKTKMPNGDEVIVQSSFSILWYFVECKDKMNDLISLYLGKDELKKDIALSELLISKEDKSVIDSVIHSIDENQDGMNDSQRTAIKSAWKSPISIINGPPGTGKTKTISNLLRTIIENDRTVAVVSNNHSAIDSVWEKINESEDMKKAMVKLGSDKNRKDSNKELQGFKFDSDRATRLEEHLTYRREKEITGEEFLSGESPYRGITSTIHSLKHCFKDGDSFLYDFVIVDECSQVNPMLGLIAMSSAKHLVLVGDDNQLPPVLGYKAGSLDMSVLDNIDNGMYSVGENKSFLGACLNRFKGLIPITSLNQHYRCHPGIFGFCAKHVYRNSPGYENTEIEIKTDTSKLSTRDYKVPMRVTWFPGNFCETQYYSGFGGKGSKQNAKQIKILMNEEMDHLLELVRPKDGSRPKSVCFLTPFKAQLRLLEKTIKQFFENENKNIKVETLNTDGDVIGEQSGTSSETLPEALTIHKSQGSEYDVVYILPVEDANWEFPFSQQKRLVNVAVSRAKEEVIIIASSRTMPVKMQEELTGKDGFAPTTGGGKKDPADEEYLQRLYEYVRDADDNNHNADGQAVCIDDDNFPYGFHKAKSISIFDEKIESKLGSNISGGEKCLGKVLAQKAIATENGEGPFKVYAEVPIAHIKNTNKEALNEEQLSYISNMSRYDFLVCDKEDKVVAAFEMDGFYHRLNAELLREELDAIGDNELTVMNKQLLKNARTTQIGDKLKDSISEIWGIPLYRFSDDGSSVCEDEQVEEIFSNYSPASKDNRYQFKAVSMTKSLKPEEKVLSPEIYDLISEEKINATAMIEQIANEKWLVKEENAWVVNNNRDVRIEESPATVSVEESPAKNGMAMCYRANDKGTVSYFPVYSEESRELLDGVALNVVKK